MIRMLKHFINRSGFFAIGNTEEMEENVGFLFFSFFFFVKDLLFKRRNNKTFFFFLLNQLLKRYFIWRIMDEARRKCNFNCNFTEWERVSIGKFLYY